MCAPLNNQVQMISKSVWPCFLIGSQPSLLFFHYKRDLQDSTRNQGARTRNTATFGIFHFTWHIHNTKKNTMRGSFFQKEWQHLQCTKKYLWSLQHSILRCSSLKNVVAFFSLVGKDFSTAQPRLFPISTTNLSISAQEKKGIFCSEFTHPLVR